MDSGFSDCVKQMFNDINEDNIDGHSIDDVKPDHQDFELPQKV